MAIRKHKLYRKVDSTEVQGDDSYVILKAMTYGDSKAYFGRITSDDKSEQYQVGNELLVKMIQEWNWVDDEGNPLPLPKDDPTVLDKLPIEEIVFLSKELGAGLRKEQDSKN